MKVLKIDLGSSGPETVAMPAPSNDKDEPKKYYPSFYYTGDKALNVPKEGEMVIRYKETSSSETTDEDGNTRYSCTIEIREIVSAEEDEETEAPAKSGTEAGDALDAIMREKIKSKKSEGY